VTKIGAGNLIKILIKFLVDSRCGVSVVNALSNHLTATVHSGDGKVYQQEYEKGKRYTQLNKLVRLQRGTIVTFILMKLFYSNNRFSYDTLPYA
jgi:DNA gyrase subunit B